MTQEEEDRRRIYLANKLKAIDLGWFSDDPMPNERQEVVNELEILSKKFEKRVDNSK